MPDPWLTENGKVHPAAEPLPEWEEDGTKYRLGFGVLAGWWIEWLSTRSRKTKHWCRFGPASRYQAAALLEKHLREKLWAKGRIALCPDTHNGTPGWHVFKYGANGMSQWLGDDGKWYLKSDAKMNVARFWSTDYTKALQAACMAAKGEDDGEG